MTIVDVDGLKTAFATPTTDQSYTDAALNGAAAEPLKAGKGPARTVSITTSANVGTYRTGASFPWVVAGSRGGKTVTESLLLTAANGGETINGTQVFDAITSVRAPGQVNGAGSVQLGVRDVYAVNFGVFRAVKPHDDGTLNLVFQDGSTDALPVRAMVPEDCAPAGVLGSTAIGVSLYV